MKTSKLLVITLFCLFTFSTINSQTCESAADWESEMVGEPLQPSAQFGGYYAINGSPQFVEENCTPGGFVGLSIKAGIDGAVGGVVGYTTQVGINPPPTFLNGVTYNVSGKKLYTEASTGTYTNLTMTITLVNGMGATQVINKSLMLIQGQCDSWDPPQPFVSPGDFDFAEIAITASNGAGEDDLFIVIDDWCIEEASNECFAEFGFEELDECGGVQFFSNITGGTFDSWQISGPNGYTNSSNVENLNIALPFAGTYIVDIVILCEDGSLQTFQQSITIDFFDEDPFFEACEDGSTEEIVGISVDGECIAEYVIPDLLPFDDSGVFTVSCFLDSTIPVVAGQTVSLSAGSHQVFCNIIDNCENESSCLYFINVTCEGGEEPCEYICCEGDPNWPVEDEVIGIVPTTPLRGYYAEFGTPEFVLDGCDGTLQSVEIQGPPNPGTGGEIVGIYDNGVGGFISLFEVGETYCISFCLKAVDTSGFLGGQLDLFASSTPQIDGSCTGSCETIGSTNYVAVGDGWTQQQIIYTPSSTLDRLLFFNNSTNVISGPAPMRIDNVCIFENPEPIACNIDIIIEEQECGKVIVNTDICGQLEEMTILYDDGFESFEVEDTTACINYPSVGPWTVTVNYICADEMTVRTVTKTFTLENKINGPTISCPGDTLINLDPGGSCIADVVLGNYSVGDPSASVQCYVSGSLVTNPSLPVQIPVGVAQVEYIATNECGADTCSYIIEVTCEPTTGKYDCPIDVLFVMDNSGSVDATEFGQMVASANAEISAISAVYNNSRFATVHYTGQCGEKLWVENDFTSAGGLLPITRKGNWNDDMNVALGSVIKALNNNLPDPNITGGPLNLDPSAKFYIVLFTDGGKFSEFFGCTDSSLSPYTNANTLKSAFNANISIVHFNAGIADDACGALASPGGSYTGIVDANPGDPDNLLLPRQYIPAPFGTPNIDLLSVMPPCSPCFDCDDLILTSNQASEDSCCYSIDFINGYGPDIVKMEAKIITPDWQFNTATTNPGTGFQWYPGTVTTGSKLCLTGASNNIPAGANPNILDYCFSPTVSSPSGPQIVVFNYYTLLNDTLFELQCSDTLTTECIPQFDDPCLTIDEINFDCNPNNAYEYFVNLTVTNNSGFTASNVTLSGLNAGFQFANCTGGSATNSIAIPVPGGLIDGGTTTICVKIIAPIPILNPTQACFNIGINSFTDCCHSPDEVCITLDPCCDPCEDISTTYTPITVMDQEVCCYSLAIDYTCDYLFFNKIRLSAQTTGVTFGYHALGNSNFQMCGSSSTDLCLEPITTPLQKGNYANVIDICFDGINDPSQIPQIVKVEYLTIDPSTNQDTIACSEDLTFECDEIPNHCLEVSNQNLICVPDSNKYRYTFTIKNVSTLPFNATDADVFIIAPTDLAFMPSGGTFPLTPNLGPNQSQTITSCIESTSSTFPSLATEIVFGYRLRYNAGDTCCYESVLDTIAIPPCDDIPSDCFSVVDVEVKNVVCDAPDCYGDPFCQAWLVNEISILDCFGIATASVDKAIYNGQTVFIIRKSYLDYTQTKIYECDGTLIQSCAFSIPPPSPACNPDAGIDLATDLTSIITIWDCNDSLPIYDPSACIGSTSNIVVDYCIKIMNNSPTGFLANQLILNPYLPSGVTVTPTTHNQNIPSGGMATINFTVAGNLSAGDTIKMEGLLSGFDDMEQPWECIDTICLPVPSCPIDSCCTDEDEFLSNIASGFLVTQLGDCTYEVCANQFDTCHYFGTLAPDWGDGSGALTQIIPSNPPNNCWTYTYNTSGTFKISMTVYEGNPADNESCWNADLCATVEPDCCQEDPCDDISITATTNSTTTDSCCTTFTIDNGFCEDYFKAIRVEVAAPATVSQISGLNGYIVNQITPQVAEVRPLFGFIGIGSKDIFTLCTTDYTTDPHQVTVSWLVPAAGGGCTAVCPTDFDISCDIDPPVPNKCYEFVTDSIDCKSNTYCFKIKNTSSPAFDINSVDLYDLSGTLGLSPTGRMTIPTLTSGATSDWICVNYFGVIPGDSACFKITAHNTPANLPPTSCCTDTKVTCFTVPDCPTSICGACPVGSIAGPNLVPNGDFEQGTGYFGWNSFYNQRLSGIMTANEHSIRNSGNLANTQWAAIDHTTGSPTGQFLALDGPSGNIAYTTSVFVNPNTDYVFCMWVDNLVATSTPSNPVIEVIIDGQVVEAGRWLPQSPDGWQLITLPFNSIGSAGLINIEVSDISGVNYNDWAIDDVSFRACEEIIVDTCCDDLDTTAIINYYNNNITVVNNECEGCVTVDIDSCDLVYVDFGSGEMPMMDLVPICQDDLATGTYTFTIRVERLNAGGDVCFEETFQKSFDIICPPVDDCCDGLDEDAFCDYYDLNIVVANGECEGCVTINLDSCDIAEVDLGDGSGFVSIADGQTLCRLFTSGGTYPFSVKVTRLNAIGDPCFEKTFDLTFEIEGCIPSDPCCDEVDPMLLDAYYMSNISFDTSNCAGCIIVDLDSCDVGTITFSGGSTQPIVDNTQICMTYTTSGTYSYTIDIVRYNTNGDTCYQYQDQKTFDIECDDNPPVHPCVQIVADSIDCETNTYCFRVRNNTVPAWTIRSLAFVNESAGHTLTPDPVSIAPLAVGDTSDWICVNYIAIAGDSVCFNLVAHQEDLGAGEEPQFCCTNPEPVCFVAPVCDIVGCCEDEDKFDDLLDMGWNVTQNGCSVTVSAPQFDGCHWISQSEPDWGDGSVAGQVITPASGTWTHTYNAGGTFTICATIFEGDNPDDICFSGEMCTEVELIDCTDPPVPCDATGVTIFNAMTPNGDGLNDRLVINGGDLCTKNIKIYNRWGQEVWAQLNYKNDWSGNSFSGEKLPDGTYFLVLEFPDETDDELRMKQTYIELRN